MITYKILRGRLPGKNMKLAIALWRKNSLTVGLRSLAIEKDSNGQPLTGEELALLESIKSQLTDKLQEKYGLTNEETISFIRFWINHYGEKNVLNSFREPIILMGVPFSWTIINWLGCIVLFSDYASTTPTMIFVPFLTIHFVCWLYYRKNKDSIIERENNKLLKKGIRI